MHRDVKIENMALKYKNEGIRIVDFCLSSIRPKENKRLGTM
jgi:serine/threonine protein kinase